MRIKPIFAWYDFWIGGFYDQKKRRLYVFPIPMFGFMWSGPMRFDPFDPLGLWPESDAREQQRRERLGRFGRLKEDLPETAAAIFLVSVYAAATVLPWAIGLYTISTWVFGEQS